MSDSPAIAIDVGSTFSRVGVFENGQFELVAVDRHNYRTATCVAFTENGPIVGDDAEHQTIKNSKNTIFDVKRVIGRRFEDPFVQSDIKFWPFVIEVDAYNSKIGVNEGGRIKRVFPEEILKIIFTNLKKSAEKHLGKTVNNAVITVPACFNDSQRQAVKQSGIISGLNVLQIINEPTAAVVPYVLNTKLVDQKNVMVFDFGGGTCDVSIVCIENQTIKVKSTAGDFHFGGEDFDNSLINHIINLFKVQHNKDLNGDKEVFCRLRKVSERVKHQLSISTHAIIKIDSLFEGISFESSISRGVFEKLNIELFQKIVPLIEKALFDAKVDKSDIEDVILVGGSSNIPRVQEILQDFFRGKKLNNRWNADDNVVFGAAIQAAILNGDKSSTIQNIHWTDVNPFTLSIYLFGELSNVIIKRNTTIPAKETLTFTIQSGEKNIHLEVYEGEHRLIDENQMLGEFKFSGLPEIQNIFFEIEVTYVINADGILNLSALEKTKKINLKTTKIGKLQQCPICDEFYKDNHIQIYHNA